MYLCMRKWKYIFIERHHTKPCLKERPLHSHTHTHADKPKQKTERGKGNEEVCGDREGLRRQFVREGRSRQ